jgi:DNA (cytosine-5)-methyltransferase 1
MITVMDWFCGAGGSSQGIDSVPGVTVTRAANHWAKAIETHALNFPAADHYQGDIREAPVDTWPTADLFWASPECPQWSTARGKRRDFDSAAVALPGMEPERDEEADRSRALMDEVPLYLAGVQRRGKLVLAGVVENVVEVRAWHDWDRWLGDLHKLGYSTRVIAMNSMHANGTRSARAPQSRDRLYVAYWHRSLGRTPDWNKWLRPPAWCPSCERHVEAVQAFKRPGADMGRYRQQYVFRCPQVSCRGGAVEPGTLPAAAAIDWTIPGQRIGDRAKPLAEKTLARIEAGLRKFARPITLEAAGNTFERRPGVRTWPVDAPLTTQTTTATKALAVPPLLVPVEGREGKEAGSANVPLRTQTARNETGLAWLPWMVELRGGSSASRSIFDPAAAVTASGNHLGVAAADWPAMVVRNNSTEGSASHLSTPVQEPMRTLTASGKQSLVTWDHLLVPYYGNGNARTVAESVGTLSTRDRYALVSGDVDIDDVLFRMLEPHEIGAAMAFGADYIVVGSKRDRVRQYGNAVTPPVAELIVSALVEAITGADLERWALAA